MKKLLALLTAILLLAACASDKKKTASADWIKDTNGFDILMNQFAHNIETIWGMNEVLIAGAKDYVKYRDNYQTRSHINFAAGFITVETLASEAPSAHLRQAIIATLLLGENSANVDLYSDADDTPLSEQPLLYGQVLDAQKQPIRWRWQAERYADTLIAQQLKQRNTGLRIIWSITLPMVTNHLRTRAHQFMPQVQQAAKKYGIDSSLILAIMEVESSFNPYAISHTDALGLMQVVQHTAGRDIYRIRGLSGKPNRHVLLDPDDNIDIGTAYLALVQNTYLAGITHPQSQRYAVITAYNGGAGSVLRVFSSDKKRAITLINKLKPEQIYQKLINSHPSEESRRYLYKVTQAQKNYQ